MTKVFIDGSEGTTGLRIQERLEGRSDLTLLHIPSELRKDTAARKELLQFPGVGPKVADCILLFSLGHTQAFPLDVWMKRAMRLMYFGGEEPCKKDMEQKIAQLGPNSGILQQYIFHYARENM